MIQKLHLRNFRSFAEFELIINERLVIIYGPNGIGKTNLLESIYCAATTKSFRASDVDLIRYGQGFLVDQLQTERLSIELRLHQGAGPRRKQLRLNGVIRPLRAVLGQVPVVLFVPADMQLFSGEAAGRRNLLDAILAQAETHYALALTRYRKALVQRNALLRRYKLGEMPAASVADQLFVWDLQLAEPAAEIMAARQRLCERLDTQLTSLYAQIAGESVSIKLTYTATAADNIAQALADAHQRDLAAGHSTVGPHRDDLTVEFGGRPLTSRASRGETRTLLLALKQAELQFLQTQLQTQPVLLLDDVFSELDESRRHYLVNTLSDYQTIITATEVNKLAPAGAQLVSLAELAHVA